MGIVKLHPWYVPPVFINAFSTNFTAIGLVNPYVDLGNVLAFEYTDAFTVSAWIKPDVSDGTYGSILNRWDGATGYTIYYSSFGNISVEMFFDLNSSDGIAVTSNDSITYGVWQHIVVTYDGSGTADGIGISIDNVASSISVGLDTLTDSIVAIADAIIGSDSAYAFGTAGRIDEFSIWDGALNASDITKLYNGGVPNGLNDLSLSANILLWLRMGDGDTYPTIIDHGPNGYDGTMYVMSSANFVADVPGA